MLDGFFRVKRPGKKPGVEGSTSRLEEASNMTADPSILSDAETDISDEFVMMMVMVMMMVIIIII